jgi:hypothetical protein
VRDVAESGVAGFGDGGGRPSDTLSMAFMALGATGNSSDYAEAEKILL